MFSVTSGNNLTLDQGIVLQDQYKVQLWCLAHGCINCLDRTGFSAFSCPCQLSNCIMLFLKSIQDQVSQTVKISFFLETACLSLRCHAHGHACPWP